MPVDGLLLLNKPAGLTSNQALQKVKRRLLQSKKAGHTGSLDPAAATGYVAALFWRGDQGMCAFLLDADKTYRVTAKLGIKQRTPATADGNEIAIEPKKPVPQLDDDAIGE